MSEFADESEVTIALGAAGAAGAAEGVAALSLSDETESEGGTTVETEIPPAEGSPSVLSPGSQKARRDSATAGAKDLTSPGRPTPMVSKSKVNAGFMSTRIQTRVVPKLGLSIENVQEQGDTTYYVIRVNYESKHLNYTVKKRYTAFEDLYNILKEAFPDVRNFSFPKKSVLNLKSSSTVERRREKFNELFEIICKMNPIPKVVDNFLEVDVAKDKFAAAMAAQAAEESMGGADDA